MNRAEERRAEVLCFGEVLWDMLPSGSTVGGAPLNVAYHLNRLGTRAVLASRIGEDANGAGIRDFLQQNQVPSLLQPDPFHPTGTVEVTVDAEGTATYDIAGDVAWDFIGPDARIDGAVRSAACLVYGSLAGRSAVSRTTLFGLLDTAATKVLDINLRHPFFDKDLLERLLMKADILKMNEQECRLVGGMFGLDGAEDERMHRLREMFGLRMILVTAGAAGATLWAPGGPYHDAGRAVEVVDTVGSGDAFLAGFLRGYLGTGSLQKALTAAGTMGAFVAGRAGGCPVYDAAETGLF